MKGQNVGYMRREKGSSSQSNSSGLPYDCTYRSSVLSLEVGVHRRGLSEGPHVLDTSMDDIHCEANESQNQSVRLLMQNAYHPSR